MAIYAYVPAGTDISLTILNVTDPTLPAFVGNIMGAGAPNYLDNITDVAQAGIYCYCACIDSMGTNDVFLTIIDVSNPAVPTFKSTLSLISSAPVPEIYVFVSGNYAYLTNRTDGLSIIDISNPAIPALVGTFSPVQMGLDSPTFIGRAYKYGDYCYIASLDTKGTPIDANEALVIVDVTNPAAPTLKGSISGLANFLGGRAAFPSGNYCFYASSFNNTLTIIDISNPAAPTFKSKLSNADILGPVGVWKEGNYCYLIGPSRFTIIDVSNASAPVVISHLHGAFTGYGLFKSGNYCYLGLWYSDTVNIIDVSDPLLPAVVGAISGAGAPNYLGWPGIPVLGPWPEPAPPPPYQSPPCIIDFKGLLDCIGWKWRAGGI